jgi:hypothetical protein
MVKYLSTHFRLQRSKTDITRQRLEQLRQLEQQIPQPMLLDQ